MCVKINLGKFTSKLKTKKVYTKATENWLNNNVRKKTVNLLTEVLGVGTLGGRKISENECHAPSDYITPVFIVAANHTIVINTLS
jgi:hypothetical protein